MKNVRGKFPSVAHVSPAAAASSGLEICVFIIVFNTKYFVYILLQFGSTSDYAVLTIPFGLLTQLRSATISFLSDSKSLVTCSRSGELYTSITTNTRSAIIHSHRSYIVLLVQRGYTWWEALFHLRFQISSICSKRSNL